MDLQLYLYGHLVHLFHYTMHIKDTLPNHT